MRVARTGGRAVALLIGTAVSAIAAQNPELSWAVRGATVIDGTGREPIVGADIVVRGDRIVCVGADGACEMPADAEVYERAGHYAIPGLWNSHAHLSVPNLYLYMAEGLPPGVADRLRRVVLRIYLASGVTGLVSLIDDPGPLIVLRNAERYGELLAPRLFTCGWGISYPNSWNAMPGTATPTTPAEAREAVAAQDAEGVDCIKITVESGPGPVYHRPRMPAEIAAAVVAEAHHRHLPVYAHATHVEETLDVARAGVDVIAHGLSDHPGPTPELIRSLRESGVYYMPTFVVIESFFRYFDRPGLLDEPFLRSRLTPEMYRALTDSTRRARFTEMLAAITEGPGVDWARESFDEIVEASRTILAAGVEPLVGTDPVWFVVPGYDVHRELELLVRAGLTPAEAIRAATLNAARAIGRESDFGTIEPGKHADFVLLTENPLADIRNTRSLDLVAKGGQVFIPQMLLGTVGAGR